MEQQELISLVEDLLGSATGSLVIGPDGSPVSGSMTGLMKAVTPIGIAIVDAASGRVARVNATFPQVMRIAQPPEAFAGVSLDRLGPTLSQPMVVAGLRQVMATGAPFTETVLLMQSQPTARPTYRRLTISPVPRRGGGSAQLLITVVDATEQVRRQMEAVAGAPQAVSPTTGEPPAAPVASQNLLVRQLAEEKHALEETLAQVREEHRTQMERMKRDLDHAQRELGMHHSASTASPLRSEGGDSLATSIATSLMPGVSLPAALDKVAQQFAQGLGDACAIFFVGADGLLHVASVHHSDPLIGSQMRTFFQQRPPRPGEGIYGRAAEAGDGVLLEAVLPADLLEIFPGSSPEIAGAGIVSAVCVPLRGAMEPSGAVLVLSLGREQGGTERRFSRQTVSLLLAASAPLSMAVYTERLRRTVETSEAQRDSIIGALANGVALYDSMGRLRSLNDAAERMLSAPTTKHQMIHSFKTPQGQEISPEDLPWIRVVRGESATEKEESLVVAWEGGASRTLKVRAVPLLDEVGQVAYAAAIFQGEGSPIKQPPSAMRPPIPRMPASASAHDPPHPPTVAESALSGAQWSPTEEVASLGDASAVALRLVSAEQRRQFELQMATGPISVPLSSTMAEQLVAMLLRSANLIFPPGRPLRFSLSVEGGGAGGNFALVRVGGPREHARPDAAKSQLEALRVRVVSVGGAVRPHDDHAAELAIMMRLPIATKPSH